MGIATEMKELTRNIASSHKGRMRRIGEIKEEVNETRGEARSLLADFEASRKETNRQMRGDLAQDRAQRNSETRGILKDAQDILKGFVAYRKEAGAQLRKNLSGGTAEIRSKVREMQIEAQKLITGFGVSRQNASLELKKDLSISRKKSKSEVGKLLESAKGMVKNFQSSRKEAGDRLRIDLAQSRANTESDVKQMLGSFGEIRENVRADLKEARDAWQGLASTMQARRGSEKTPLKAEEVPVVEEEARNLEAEMLAIVNEHLDGIDLVGVAEQLGVAPVVLGRVSKSLVDKGEVRKDEKLYFPKVSE